MSKIRTTNFADRALKACLEAMTSESISPRHVKDVLRCPELDVSPIEKFLESANPLVRKSAAEIVGTMGDYRKLIPFVLKEKSTQPLLCGFRMLSRAGKEVAPDMDQMVHFLNYYDLHIRDAVVEMFRMTGRTDLLTPVLFEEDESTVYRVKKMIEEAEDDDGKTK